MPEFQHDTIVPYKDSVVPKKQQVADMFNKIAFRYDFLNRVLSGGIDRSWRKKAIRELNDLDPKNILDVATGTADMPLMLRRFLNPEKITGIDISNSMLEIGRQKIIKSGLENVITLQEGDGESINFPENSFDAVTVAFGVRNFQNLENGLSEMLRVMKPGGKLVILEFSKPGKGFFLPFYKIYLRIIAPRIGKAVSGNAFAYQYLNDSVNAFPEGEAFMKILKISGYGNIYHKKLSWGICTIYCGTK
ncbi:MAG TPA: bifunctional demethylmenaquinone methyltransferase/2-methoxy-6-polyprenyl-1,4-benzoquinol methylase UbiE [Puia sp.]|nr:bifunctional demethylmenaquinone methyltransferase/2-methoxy-6-polyprenyl-1,4-benzoquinol methylase UbiE [Puia sp.]